MSVPDSTEGGTAARTGSTEAASTRRPLPTGEAASSSTVPGISSLPLSITYGSTVTAAAAKGGLRTVNVRLRGIRPPTCQRLPGGVLW
ncbi:hypothetical protein GCM10023086_23510 [Streptomyces venetus]|uniref:Uncharacterized protein n=1 Tax=Streptomyces venetus TaxID=1701086 RepID=A0ABP8FK33_9ACTN